MRLNYMGQLCHRSIGTVLSTKSTFVVAFTIFSFEYKKRVMPIYMHCYLSKLIDVKFSTDATADTFCM